MNLGRGVRVEQTERPHMYFWILLKLVPNYLHIHILCQTLLAESKLRFQEPKTREELCELSRFLKHEFNDLGLL